MRPVLLLVPLACLLILTSDGFAQQAHTPPVPGPVPVLQGRPDLPAAPLPLAEPFRSPPLGIALRPPAGFKTVRKLGGNEVHFVDEQRKWTLKIARMSLTDTMGLETTTDEKQNLPRAGLLEVTVERLKAAMPGAVVLRSDVVDLGATEAGMIAVRHVEGLEPRLSQQALVRGGDRLYFVISLASPGSKIVGNQNAKGQAAEDPGERQAVETFQSVLDTVELLDQLPIRLEQDKRLYATLALYLNLGAEGKLEKALVPRQWFRIVRNGKDIGYLYTVEETAQGIPGHQRAATAAARARGKAAAATLASEENGILIGMRSRTLPDENVQVDSESWMFCTPDRRSEQWSTQTVVQDKKSKTSDHAMTFGASSKQSRRVLDKAAEDRGEQWDKDDPGQPPVLTLQDYQLSVTHVSKTETAQPIAQGLPKCYLPQALGHLLPRVLPLREAKQYMFATYVEEARAVMLRYVDVGSERRVTLAGEPMRAIPIGDRIGLEGSVTTHYVTSGGKYLGSENADGGIVVLPTTEQALLKMWKDADFTRPADLKQQAETPTAETSPTKPANPAAAAAPRSPRERVRRPAGR